MQIVKKKVEDLKVYEKNPRNNKDAVDYVANSIKEFGFKVPVIVDKNNVIVAGHTRYLASQKLGLKEIPCIVADDLSDEQVKAFRLADNKVSEIATWDFGLLNEELDDIMDLDMSDFGFNTDDVELDIVHEEKEDAENIASQKYLTFGQYKIPIDEEELALMVDKIDDYLEEYGTSYGFVRNLLGDK